METVRLVTELLRVLLTLAALYGLNSRAAVTTIPEDIDVSTFLDDEDVNIDEKKAGVQFVVDFLSNVNHAYCTQEYERAAVLNGIKTKLLADLQEECKCLENLNNVISKDKLECDTLPVIKYSGEIPNWSSTTYNVQKLAQFLSSWSTVVQVDGSVFGIPQMDFKFLFNVTDAQSIIVSEIDGIDEADGSGDEPGSGEEGEMTTIETKVEENKTDDIREVVIPVGLDGTSRGERIRFVGAVVTLSVALASVLSFVLL